MKLRLAILLAVYLLHDSSGSIFEPFSCVHVLAVIQNQLQTETCEPLDSPPPRPWNCSSLQSALRTVPRLNLADLPENSSNCVTITLPSGRHFITDTVHLGNVSLFLVGSEDENGPPAIHCNYTVEEVDEERRFDPDYVYVDYTLYLNRSDIFWMESVDMFNCPYPLRLDTIRSVHITNSTFRYFTEAVFDIFNSPNVSMTGSTFMDNSGTRISRFSFRGNTGAVALGYNNIETDDTLQPRAVVSHCNFINNSAATFKTTSDAFFNQVFTGRGGGLGIFINESKLNITCIVSDCTFVSNYAIAFGGALFMVMFGENTTNTLLVERSNFTSNRGDRGGGEALLSFFSEGIDGAPHTANITDCTFRNNSGQTGGAVLRGSNRFAFLKLERCNFSGNSGLPSPDDYGSAVGVWMLDIEDRQFIPSNQIVDCIFEENTGINGIVNIGYVPFTFLGKNYFINNQGSSPLKNIGAMVDLHDYLEFSGNRVGTGTAFEMFSLGQIRIHPDLRMNFTNNTGRFGASLSSSVSLRSPFPSLPFNPRCFVLYETPMVPPSEWENVSIIFRRNEAMLASALYASSLESCSWYSTRFPFFNFSQILEWPVWDFGDDSMNTGYEDLYNTQYHVETFPSVIETLSDEVKGWPGQTFNISLIVQDEFDTPTSVEVSFRIGRQDNHFNSSLQPQAAIIGPDSTLVNNFSLKYGVSTEEAAMFSDSDPGLVGSVDVSVLFDGSERFTDHFEVYSSPCPGGYELRDSPQQTECFCKEQSQQILNCEEDQDSIIIQSGYWASASVSLLSPHSTVMNFYTCPPGYCRCVQNSSLGEENCVSVFINSDHDAQCHCDRQGTLCGECREGRGVSVLLNRCITCSNVYGLLILVLIVVDAAVFIILTLIDKQVPASLYVFTFYIQIASYASLYFPETFEVVGRYFYYISSVLGFYFPYDFCLYQNMSPLISYFIRLSPFLLACLVIPIVISLWRKIKWDRPLNYRGLCLVVLLVYSPTVHTAMSILHCPFIQDKNGTSALRWFVSGSVVCFSGGHLPLSLLAIAVLVLLVLLIPFTVVITLLGEMPQKFYWVEKIRTQLTHGYKDKYKWWFGVELSRRFISVLFIVVFPREQVAILLILCIVLAVYGYIQPYKDTITNILEITVELNFLLLLILVTSPILDHYHSLPPIQSSASETIACDERGTAVVTWILMPFLYFPLALCAGTCVLYVACNIKILYHRFKGSYIFHRFLGSKQKEIEEKDVHCCRKETAYVPYYSSRTTHQLLERVLSSGNVAVWKQRPLASEDLPPN